MKNTDLIIKSLDQDELSESILKDIKELLNKAYYNSNMYMSFVEDLKNEHKYFKIFLAYSNNILVGMTVLQDKIHKGMEYFGYPPVHLKRFTVDPKHRSYGIGKKLLGNVDIYF